MATENPKVSAYVPQILKDRLTEFREEREISESQAVIIILAEYFGVEQEINRQYSQVGGVSLSRVEEIEAALTQLQELVDGRFSHLNNRIAQIEASSLPLEVSKLPRSESTLPTVTPDLPTVSRRLPVEQSSLPTQAIHVPLFEPFSISTDSLRPVSGRRLGTNRFGSSISSVSDAKRKFSTQKFTEWLTEKDPDGIPWKYVTSPSKGYLPDIDIESLPSEVKSELLKWMNENV